ncbi:hypothetical protein ACOSQ3_025082 [Xanthoceras sorbifolium]
MQLTSASILPMVLKSTIELDLLEIIAKASRAAHLSPTEVADQPRCSNNARPHLLASYSILTCSLFTLPDGKVERIYGFAPVCKFLTKNEDDEL